MTQPLHHLRDRLREALGPRPSLPAPWRSTPSAPSHRIGRPFLPYTVSPGFSTSAFSSPEGPQIHHLLPGFWQDTPLGRVFVVEQRFELDHCHGRFPLGQALDTPLHLWARLGRDDALASVDPRRIVFLDTETTGLAGGAGTTAFLIGIGHFLDGHFRLRQYFLAGFNQEAAMLRALADYLDNFEAVVTFNGKTFDLPLLDTRLILNRQRRGLTALPHLDLLHPSRRLYRDRIASCRLSELERSLLGLVREEDVPGAEIPSLYFRYMRNRRFRALLPIFEHNANDVLSLVTLTIHLARLVSGAARLSASDHLRLGRTCDTEGRDEEALTHYRAALALDLRPAELEDCEDRLGRLCKRLGRWDEAAAVWQAVAARPDNRRIEPLIELAMYRERILHDLTGARVIAERALLLLESYHARRGYSRLATQRTALQRRIARLQEREARGRMLKPPRARRAPAKPPVVDSLAVTGSDAEAG